MAGAAVDDAQPPPDVDEAPPVIEPKDDRADRMALAADRQPGQPGCGHALRRRRDGSGRHPPNVECSCAGEGPGLWPGAACKASIEGCVAACAGALRQPTRRSGPGAANAVSEARSAARHKPEKLRGGGAQRRPPPLGAAAHPATPLPRARRPAAMRRGVQRTPTRCAAAPAAPRGSRTRDSPARALPAAAPLRRRRSAASGSARPGSGPAPAA